MITSRVSTSLLLGATLLSNALNASAGVEMTNVIKIGGDVHPRLFLDEFLLPENAAQHDLLIQGWQAVNDRGANDPLGTWEIMTIHATPIKPYDGAFDPNNPGTGVGYCLHNTNTFAAWHRLHTALFEQRVRQEAEAIADRCPEKFRDEY